MGSCSCNMAWDFSAGGASAPSPRETLPEIADSSLGGRKSSRPPTPDVVCEEEANADLVPPLNSSRGIEEHRADPALRAALESLDAVSHSVPSMDDFTIESYLGRRGGNRGSTSTR